MQHKTAVFKNWTVDVKSSPDEEIYAFRVYFLESSSNDFLLFFQLDYFQVKKKHNFTIKINILTRKK